MTTPDPFSGVGETDEKPEGGDTLTVSLDDIFQGMVETDEEYIEPDAVARWVRPTDRTIIPVEIIGAKIEYRDKKIVIAREGDKTHTIPSEIDAAVKERGCKEEVIEASVPQFELELQPRCEIFGVRYWPYRMFVPAYALKIALRRPQGNKLGFSDVSGHNLRKATGVTTAGQKLDRDALPKLAEAMVGKVVMAQVKYDKKDATEAVDRVDEEGKLIQALVDEHGTPISVKSHGEGVYTYTDDGTEVPADVVSKLIEHNGNFVIRDDSDDSIPLKEVRKIVKVFDNLNSNVLPVPERGVTVMRSGGETVEGEITWDTIGLAMKTTDRGYMASGGGIPIAAKVQVLIPGGELITANWSATQWVETEKAYTLKVVEAKGADNRDEGNLILVAEDGSGLDVFKGKQNA